MPGDGRRRTVPGMTLRSTLRVAGVLAALVTGCAVPTGGVNPPPGLGIPDTRPGTGTGAPDTETIVRAVDGDTFELSASGTVRLIGIDTPESVRPGHPVECHATTAAAAAARLTGLPARLETDPVAGERDRYGRRLAYLWYLRDGTWHNYNLEAIVNGDAEAYAYGDQDYRHRRAFEAAEAVARARGAGLWSC